jgi:hypothetical protein
LVKFSLAKPAKLHFLKPRLRRIMHCAGVGVYTEDGNEVANVISRNVFICHDIFYCRIEWQNNLGVGPAQKEGKCRNTEYIELNLEGE